MDAPKTLQEAIVHFSDPERAFVYAVNLRWPDGHITCPRCGGDKHSFIKTRLLWFCKGCKRQFTVKVRTIFEDSPIGLNKWMTAVWMLVNAKNGISSHELGRAIGVTQKTAWFMLQRVRNAMHNRSFGKTAKLGGPDSEVEADETYIGGKVRNMHKDRRVRFHREGGSKASAGKSIVRSRWHLPDDSNSSSLGFSSPQDALDHARKVAKDAKNWSSTKNWNLAKRYTKGDIDIVVRGSIPGHHGDYDLIFSPVPFGTKIAQGSIQASARRVSDKLNISNVDSRLNDGSVFMGITQLVQCPKRGIPSFVRLEPSKDRPDFYGDVLGFSFEVLVKLSSSIPEGKISRFLELPLNHSTSAVIQRRTEVFNSRNGRLGDCGRQSRLESDLVHDIQASISLRLGNSFVHITSEKLAGQLFQFKDVLLCPSETVNGCGELSGN